MTDLNRRLRKERQGFKPQSSIILIYALLGPPVGSVIFLLGVFLISLEDGFKSVALTEPSVIETLKGVGYFILFFVFTIPFSYIYGFVQALLTGAVLSEILKRRGKAGYLAAFLTPLVIGLGVYVISDFGIEREREVAAAMVVVGVLASLVLRFLFSSAFNEK